MWGDCRVRRRIRWHPARVGGAGSAGAGGEIRRRAQRVPRVGRKEAAGTGWWCGFRGCGVPRVEMPGLGGVGVVSEHGQGGGFSRDTGARICPCSPPPLGGGCCWWWCGFRGCWLQSAVLALCIHCRVLSVQGGWFFFLLPRGKRKGRRARKGGDEVWALALAGGVGAGAWFTRRVREDRVRVPRGGVGAGGGVAGWRV